MTRHIEVGLTSVPVLAILTVSSVVGYPCVRREKVGRSDLAAGLCPQAYHLIST
jgi:hypothetical protein